MFYLIDSVLNAQPILDDAADDPQAVVSFDPTVYGLAEPLIVRGQTDVCATGALFVGVNGNHQLLRSFQVGDSFAGYEGPSDITVRGGTWDGQGHLSAAGVVDNVMNFCHGRRIAVLGARILNVAGAHAIELAAIDGAIVRDCRFEGFSDPGNRAFSEAVQIDGTYSPASTGIGLWDDTPCRDVQVVGCYAGPSDDSGPFGALCGSHVREQGVVHTHIRVDRCRVAGSLSYGVRPYGWVDSSVTRCVIEDTAGTSILCQYSAGMLIAGNTVRGAGSNGVNVSSSAGVNVTDNVIEGTQDNYGVWIGEDSEDVRVGGNTIRGGDTAAVRLSSGADRCVVAGNMLRRGAGGPIGVSCGAGNGTVNRVVDNDMSGFSTNVLDSSGTVLTSW